MKVTKIFLLFSIVVFLVNIGIFIKRDDFSFEKQSSYYELYPDYKTLSINSFKVLNDSTLQIELNNICTKPVNWSIKVDSVTKNIKSLEPILTLHQGVFDYNIVSSNFNDSLQLKIEYFPDSFFKKINSDERNRITIFRSKIPENSISQFEKWKKNKISISSDELKSLNQVLVNDVGIKPGDDTYIKSQKISKYLCYNISNSKGTPNIQTKNLSVYKQYIAALNHIKIDCGIFAKIFSLFATQANIINRIIELKHNYGTFDSDIHVFNEYYINETQTWAATDIMLNNISYFNTEGDLMNAVQVKNQAKINNANYVLKSNLFANSKDSIIRVTFSDLGYEFFNYYYYDRDLCYYYETNLNTVYTVLGKFKRYAKRNVWKETYSDLKVISNELFFLKQFFIFSLLALMLITLISFVIEKNFFLSKKN